MKTAIHYGLTPAEDEVWLILTADETRAWVNHPCLHGDHHRLSDGVLVVMNRAQVRASARTVLADYRQLPVQDDGRVVADQLAKRLTYAAEWLTRSALQPTAIRVAEARAGAGA